MLQIGLFAKMNQVTVKTLRYYDEIGLLHPSYVDERTGYRYYDPSQIESLHRIVALRQLDFSIQEIASLLSQSISGPELSSILEQRIEALQKKIDQARAGLVYFNDAEGRMNTSILIKPLPEVVVASKRVTIENYDEFFKVVPAMGEVMKKHGARCAVPEYCFTIYHDGEYKDSNIDAEICEAVVKKLPDGDGVVYKVVPAVTEAACILHKGPYRTLGQSYSQIMRWIGENGYELAENPRESYIDGIWNKDDEAEWLTEIQIPVRKK